MLLWREPSLLWWTEPKDFLKHVATTSRKEFPKEWRYTYIIKPIQHVILFSIPFSVLGMATARSLTLAAIIINIVVILVACFLYISIRINSQYEPKTIIFKKSHLLITGPIKLHYHDIMSYSIIHDSEDQKVYRFLEIKSSKVHLIFLGVPNHITDKDIHELFQHVGIERTIENETSTVTT